MILIAFWTFTQSHILALILLKMPSILSSQFKKCPQIFLCFQVKVISIKTATGFILVPLHNLHNY